MIVWLDGRLVPHAEARVHIDDAGFLFGDGVFETALLQDGGFLVLRQHLDRLAESAGMLGIPAPATAELDAVVRTVCRENGLRNANIRITLTRGGSAPLLLVTARPQDPSAIARARHGWRIITARTRRPSTAAVPAQLKALGRTYALLARREAAAAGVDDALLLTDAGDVCEGPSWNVFWRVGDTLRTPDLDAGVLAGFTRGAIIDLARSAGFRVEERRSPRAELDSAEEVFATMTSAGIAPVRELDGRILPAATPAADALLPAYLEYVRTRTAADPL